MTADFHPHPAAPPKNEAAEKTLNIRVDRKRNGAKILGAILALAVLAGIIVAIALDKLGGDAGPASGAVSGSVGGGSSDSAAGAAVQAATDCPNPDGDAFVDWFCKQIQPAFQVSAADHARIDRLEAERGGTDTLLWVIVIAVGVLTVYNTVDARRARGTKKG